jgi:hypothetical protein
LAFNYCAKSISGDTTIVARILPQSGFVQLLQSAECAQREYKKNLFKQEEHSNLFSRKDILGTSLEWHFKEKGSEAGNGGITWT